MKILLGSGAGCFITRYPHNDSIKYYYLLIFGKQRHEEVIQFVKYHSTKLMRLGPKH